MLIFPFAYGDYQIAFFSLRFGGKNASYSQPSAERFGDLFFLCHNFQLVDESAVNHGREILIFLRWIQSQLMNGNKCFSFLKTTSFFASTTLSEVSKISPFL